MTWCERNRVGYIFGLAGSWHVERQVIARIEASPKSADSRFVVTNIAVIRAGSMTRSTTRAARTRI
jgi:hypothetical protein